MIRKRTQSVHPKTTKTTKITISTKFEKTTIFHFARTSLVAPRMTLWSFYGISRMFRGVLEVDTVTKTVSWHLGWSANALKPCIQNDESDENLKFSTKFEKKTIFYFVRTSLVVPRLTPCSFYGIGVKFRECCYTAINDRSGFSFLLTPRLILNTLK